MLIKTNHYKNLYIWPGFGRFMTGYVHAIKKKDLIVAPSSIMCWAWYRPQISYENGDRFSKLKKNENIVLLPNHQTMLDLVLEGIALRDLRLCNGNQLMRTGFRYRKFFETYGALFIENGEEIGKAEKKHRWAALDMARESEKEIYTQIFPYLLSKDEVLVVHPEGTRHEHKKNVSNTRKSIGKLLATQSSLGEQITFVPLRIDYQRMGWVFPKATLTFGRPIKVPDDGLEALADHWFKEAA